MDLALDLPQIVHVRFFDCAAFMIDLSLLVGLVLSYGYGFAHGRLHEAPGV